ncbi:MAG TPA: AAA family ATPase [Gaiellaceae bacterium]|nr:AAA family ATPase [Gaiellaceae bacterium]
MTGPAAKILLVLEDGFDAAEIEEALPAEATVQSARLNGRLPLADAAEAELLVVACASDRDHALEAIKAIHGQLQSRPPVVVIYAGSPNGFMERAFEAGADDLIALPQPREQLAFALEKALVRRRGATSTKAGTMIAVLGPKGGTGKTLTACNLAEALAGAGASPVLVDLDLQFGDVGLALGLRPEQTIYNLASAGGSLDVEKIESFLARHRSGASALLAPVRPDQAATVSPGFLRTVFDLLRSRHEFVIVDTPPAFTPEVIAAIDAASHLCVVGMLDALSLKDTKIGLETLSQMGYDPADVTLVLNRADTSVGISMVDVERLLGRRPDVLVPSNRAIPTAITEGRTIVDAEPESEAARAFVSLAQMYLAGGKMPRLLPLQPAPRRRLPLLKKGAA